ECFDSQAFCPSTDPRYAFHLSLHPQGIDEASKDYISLYLHNGTNDIEQVSAQYRFAILDQSGQKHNISYGIETKFKISQFKLIYNLGEYIFRKSDPHGYAKY